MKGEREVNQMQLLWEHCKGINYSLSVSKDLPLVMLNTNAERDVR